MELHNDELSLDFTDYSQLSFFDEGNEHVELFLGDNSVGYVMVYTDAENDNREYICVNYEIVYLDTIEEI